MDLPRGIKENKPGKPIVWMILNGCAPVFCIKYKTQCHLLLHFVNKHF